MERDAFWGCCKWRGGEMSVNHMCIPIVEGERRETKRNFMDPQSRMEDFFCIEKG